MTRSPEFLSASQAARQLGVSTKALRLYEQRGLVSPVRTQAGWRTYGPTEMAQAAEIAALRALGLSLAQVAQVLKGDPECLEPALAAHQTALEGQICQLTDQIEKVRSLRASLAQGRTPAASQLASIVQPGTGISIRFDLPWPWGGETFELSGIAALNYITGPLGCGKTRLAQAIAETVPDATFSGLERMADEGGGAQALLDADPALRSQVGQTMNWLIEEGATDTPALIALVTTLEADVSAILVIDMIEDGLDEDSQEALMACLRKRGPAARPLFLLTRSCAILDLAAVGPDEKIILCPANHSPPLQVAPWPGAPGYEAVATCLASPEVRARTKGVIAWRPKATQLR
ncbi:MAG: MerR family transcriptional regulator [Rhizobiales bacterium]|nr:MerR family transcriptional regulator [Hyphomicrobiales bacterium]